MTLGASIERFLANAISTAFRKPLVASIDRMFDTFSPIKQWFTLLFYLGSSALQVQMFSTCKNNINNCFLAGLRILIGYGSVVEWG